MPETTSTFPDRDLVVRTEVYPRLLLAQAKQAFDNVKAVVESAGLTMEHVVYTQVYLEDMSKYEDMNQVFAESFGKTPPARAVLGVARVPDSAHSDQRRRGAQPGRTRSLSIRRITSRTILPRPAC